MENMSTNHCEVLNDIFYNVQFNKTCHKRYMKQLTSISKQYDVELFLKEFINCLKMPLSMNQNHPSIENTLQFAAKFAVSSYQFSDKDSCEAMSPFLEQLFEFLLKHHKAKNSSVRFRICHFLNILLNSMGENAFVDDALCDKITVNMMDRLLDKSQKVRAQAIFALHRLQDPSDENCPIIKMYIFHLSKDPKVEVRKAVLKSMAKNQKTLHAVLNRVRDVNYMVRKMAYDFISKITVRSLTIKQRNQLLNEGLKDRSDVVRGFVENVLLPTWLRYFKGEYIDLIKALDAEIRTDVSLLALNVLFKKAITDQLIIQIPIDESTKLIPVDKLSSENSLYWRCVVKHFHITSSLDELERILPELSNFCEYINQFITMIASKSFAMWEKQTHQFILLQLFEIIRFYDLSDEAGRNNLSELMLNVLLTDHCSQQIIECIVKHFENVIPDVNKRLDLLANTISKLRTPTKDSMEIVKEISAEETHENNMQKARLRVKLLELGEEEYEAIKNKEYLKAEKLKEQLEKINQDLIKLNEQQEPSLPINDDDIEEEKNDSETMIKCLTIMCSMMKVKSIKTLVPTLRCLLNIALSSLDHPDDKVHLLALEALGIFCILDKELAKNHIFTFLLQFSLEEEKHDIWIITLKALFDLLTYYGVDFFDFKRNENDDNSVNHLNKPNKTIKLFNQIEDEDFTCSVQSVNQIQNPDIMKILIGLMDNVNQDLRNIATEGLCKLIINLRINSPTLLARIIIMYFNPTNSDDTYLCQCISCFFERFILMVPTNQEMLEEAFFPTLKIICNAPDISPLQEINLYDIAVFILKLTSNRGSNRSNVNAYCVHNNLAFAILAEILNSDSKVNKDVLIKCLKDLDVQVDDDLSQKNLKDGIEKVSLLVNKFDKRLIKYVEIFKKKLESSDLVIETGMEETDNDTDTEE